MEIIKVAITGGPSGGKTTLIEALKKDLGQKCAVVPEAASILYRGGFPRFKNKQGQIHAQRAIFHTQRELEEMITFESQKNLIVCDRGSLDSLAYWPLDEDNFLNSFQTTKEQEWKRYQWVLHLDTASPDFYDSSNTIRTETYLEAQELNLKIKKAWEGHPRIIVISQKDDFISKMTTAMSIIKAIMAHQNIETIQQIVGQK